jgi:hypothetical protein
MAQLRIAHSGFLMPRCSRIVLEYFYLVLIRAKIDSIITDLAGDHPVIANQIDHPLI